MSRLGNLRLGITETPRVFDTPVGRPVSEGAILAQDLLQALGGVGEVAGQITSGLRRQEVQVNEQANAERIAEAQQRQLDADIAQEQRGLATRAADSALTRYREQIQNRSLLVPDGQPVDEFVDELIAKDNVGQPAAFAEKYGNDLRTALGNEFLQQQEAIKVEVTRDAFANYRDAAMVAESADDIQAVLTEASTNFPMVGETERLASIVVPAGQLAAEDGDEDAVNAVAAILGDRFPDQQALMRAKLTDAQRREQTRLNDEYEDVINEHILAGTPSEVIERYLQVGAQQNLGRPEWRLGLKNRIQSAREERVKEAARIELRSAKARAESDVVSIARALSIDTGAGGGLTRLPDKFEVKMPDGSMHQVNGKEIAQRVTDEFVTKAYETSPTPAEAFIKTMAFVGRNGVIPTQWSSTIDGAELGVTVDGLVPAKGGEIKPVPPRTNAAYELYRDIRKLNPGLAETVVKSKQTSTFFEMVAVAEELPKFRGDRNAAMLAAARAAKSMGRRPANARTLDVKVDGTEVEGLDSEDANYVENWIRNAANLFRELGPGDDRAFIDRAKASFEARHFKVNGFYVPVPYKNDRYQTTIAQAGQVAAEAYAVADAKIAKDTPARAEGVSKKHLTLMPDGPDRWILVNGKTGLPVERINEPGVAMFSDEDLERMVAEDSAKKRTAEQKRLAKEQEDGRGFRIIEGSQLGKPTPPEAQKQIDDFKREDETAAIERVSSTIFGGPQIQIGDQTLGKRP